MRTSEALLTFLFLTAAPTVVSHEVRQRTFHYTPTM